jgi:deoxycytidylate deaminase
VKIGLSARGTMGHHEGWKIATKAGVSQLQPNPGSYANHVKGRRCNQGSSVGQGLDTCLCIHAEENALLEAGRERVGKGSILYCDT